MVSLKIFAKRPEEAVTIHLTVFCDEQGFHNELDDIDDIATHLVVYWNDKPVGTCRVFLDPQNQRWTLGRLAILKAYRGKSLGSYLVEQAELYALKQGATSLWLHAQEQAIPFYEKCGYVPTGSFEPDEGCPHIWMTKSFR